MKQIPDKLPAYHFFYGAEEFDYQNNSYNFVEEERAVIVPSTCSEKNEWIKQPRFYDLSMDITVIDNSDKLWNLFMLVTQAFDLYVRFSQFGYTRLSQAEELAIKTIVTFYNPHPFLVLEEEYKKAWNNLKATEMWMIEQKIAH